LVKKESPEPLLHVSLKYKVGRQGLVLSLGMLSQQLGR